jgi:formamidopyrimidine-DNA glycosylase
MPELPEVETVVRDLLAHGLRNAVIRSIDIRWPRLVSGVSPSRFSHAVANRILVDLSRRAKYIVATLDSGDRLLIHLRMTGKLRFAAPDEHPGKHDHAVIHFTDGTRLFFNDTRKFGRFRLAVAGSDPLAALGPEPLSPAFTADVLRQRLAKKRRMIKPLLLDQATVAGLGNIYVDESLWQARLHPTRRADTLTAAEIRRLHDAIVSVLRRGVENCGTTLGTGQTNFYSVSGHRGQNADALNVFRRDGLPCPRCGAEIVRTVVGQRGTHLCPRCQRAPAVTAP